MNSRLLGRSSLRVSNLCYGGWRLAGSEGAPAVTSHEPGKRAVLAAADAGYTFFDFADIYGGGRCETIFGEAMRESPGLRERLVVASKCGIRRADDPTPGVPFRYDFSADHIVRSVEGSLQRLGIETLDLLMLHRPDALMEPTEVAGAFVALRESGKVREFGVSNFRPSQVSLLQQACPFPLVVHQVEISLLHTDTLDDGTLDQCQADRITPMAWSPLARGALVSTAATTTHEDRRQALGLVLDELASTHQVSRGAIALAWLLRHPAGIVPIVGSASPDRIRELARADAIQLSREEWYRLWETSRGARLP
jgi:predicted oxidoreductase